MKLKDASSGIWRLTLVVLCAAGVIVRMHAGVAVGTQAFYAWGGGGQFAVMVPSLDMVVVTLYGGIKSHWVPPPDIATYKGREFFPLPTDVISKTR